MASSKYYVVRHRFTSMSQLSNTREFISNLDFRQLCQIYCFISFDFFPHRLFNCLRFSEQQHFLREVMIIREIVLIVQIDSANWLHRQRPVHIQPDHRRGGGELSHGRLCSLWNVWHELTRWPDRKDGFPHFLHWWTGFNDNQL